MSLYVQEHDACHEDYKRFLSEANPAIFEPLHMCCTPKKAAKHVGAEPVSKDLVSLQTRYDALKKCTDIWEKVMHTRSGR